MFNRQSDVSERMPLYTKLRTDIRRRVDSGALADADPAIAQLLDGAIPVGLDRQSAVVIPRSYDPEVGPPVLMLHPGEQIEIPWSRGMEKSLKLILGKSALQLHIPRSVFEKGANQSRAVPTVAQTVIRPRLNGQETSPIYIPKLITVPSDLNGKDPAATIAHELDHWDFFLDEAPKFYDPSLPRLDVSTIKTLAEARAYQTSYDVERNLGFHNLMPSPEELAARHTYLGPTEVSSAIITDFLSLRDSSEFKTKLSVSLAAVALTQLYPTPPDQVTTYRAAGWI